MNVQFDDMERGSLRHFNSGEVTLNNSPTNSPQRSRNPSFEAQKQTRMDLMNAAVAGNRVARCWSKEELDIQWMGVVVILCFFASGLIDAVAFNSWNCFVGMQTGNTVFAALGIGGQPVASHRQQYYKSLVAIGSFCIGTLFFNFVHRYHTGLANQPRSRRRSIFFCSFMIQTIFIIVAAAMVQVGAVSNQPYISGTFSSGSHLQQTGPSTNYLDLAPIAILSFEAAGQVCLSRVLELIELPTIVLSTLYHDFVADLYMTRQVWQNSDSLKDFVFSTYKRQEKRFMSIAALFCGALVGGEMYKSNVGMAGALWLGAGIKFAISIGFLFWKADTKDATILPK